MFRSRLRIFLAVVLGVSLLSVAAELCRLLDLERTNLPAFEGGPTGTFYDAGIDTAVPEAEQVLGRYFDIPTGAPPSPRFGARPFSQQMLRFEELGVTPFPDPASVVPGDPSAGFSTTRRARVIHRWKAYLSLPSTFCLCCSVWTMPWSVTGGQYCHKLPEARVDYASAPTISKKCITR